MVTRAQVGTVKPNPRFHGHTSYNFPLPKSPSIALSDPNWRDVMYDEYNALIRNSTWILVPKPPNVNMVRSMWLFRHKYHVNGSLSRYKACLVANGLHQLDVKNAFLNGDLSETVYMYQPPGFMDSRSPHHVCQLQRSLYGLKQAPRAWFQRFARYALRVGFSSLRYDSSLFIYQHGTEKKYEMELLDRAHMASCNPTQTPFDTESKLSVDRDLISDPTLYRSLAGGLQYLTFTRPDISYAVQHVCLHMHDPREPYFSALKRVLRYVRGTLNFRLQLYASSIGSFVSYSEANWAGFPTTRCSTFGYCVFLGDNLLSWSSKRQHTLSRSSTEAEYRGVANVVAETAWLYNLLYELHTPLLSASLTSNVHQESLADVGSETRPLMLERGSYIPWASRFRRYLNRKRETRKWLNKAIDDGPYEFRMFTPSDTDEPKIQTEEDLRGDDLKYYEA
ncbi:ribonuclease H-like domain-containing protein [Tanacetum coccineum]|uniref:Ribonuclease H-like domain-containing protein n=1 Tax=Tanacetum coccineum TaxID=301880 RepID=A0ABQ5A3Z4_9ASTR